MKRFLAFAAVLGLASFAFAASPEVLDGESRTKLLLQTDGRYEPLGAALDLTGLNSGGGTGILTNMAGLYIGSVPVMQSKGLGALTAAVTNNLAITGNAITTASLVPSGATQVLTLSGMAANGYYQLELNPTNAVSTLTFVSVPAASWLTAVPTALTANKKSVLSIYSSGTTTNNLVISFKEAP